MKKLKFPLVLLLLSAVMACKKADNATVNITGNVTSSDAADIVGSSLSANSSGFASINDDVTVQSQIYVDAHIGCGATRTDTITKQSPAGAAVSYKYGLGYTYTLNCNSNNLPDNVTGKVNYSGNYSGPHIASTNTGNLIFRVAGLTPTAASYVINGTFFRSGSFSSKADTSNHGSSNLTVEIKDVLLHKPERSISGGSATFSLSGTVPRKGNFSFSGTLVFNGDGTARLTVNGSAYIINLTTGEKTKA